MVSSPTRLMSEDPRLVEQGNGAPARVVAVVPWVDSFGSRPGWRFIEVYDLEGNRLRNVGHTPQDGDPWARVADWAAAGVL